jgi:hypothetical protein
LTWTKNVSCSIEITDLGGSGVNKSLIDYSISIDNGAIWSEWLAPEIFENMDNIVCTVEPTFDDGDGNLIRWRANDEVGNLNISNYYRICIDTINVTFNNATPSENEWQPDPMLICNITIEDYHSGVDAGTIEFSTSTSGIWSYGDWVSAKQAIDGMKVNVSVDPTFEEGDDNFIRWRANDVAGNGPFVSGDYQIKVKLNHPPTSTLLLPENNSIIRTSLPELIWKGTDIDGDTPLYYNVYLSTDKNEVNSQAPSALKTSNIINTRYKIASQLENGSTYYWTVIPNDGVEDGICESNIWQFQIDLSVEIPVVTLVAPINNSNVTSTTPTLSWNVKYSNINLLTYDIYLDHSPDPKNMTTQGFNEISYSLIQPLTPGKTYFWTVIPTAHTGQGKIQGICDSNIWSFTIKTGFAQIYGVQVELETQNLTVEQDGYVYTNVTITNIGNSVDMISLSLDKDVLNANVALEHLDTPIRLENNETIILKLQIMAFEDTKSGTYQLEITAVSNGALSVQEVVSDSKVINIKVIPKEGSEKNGQQDANMMIMISLIIIIIIIIISILVFYRVKKKKIPTVKAELLHKPPELLALPGAPLKEGDIEPTPELPTPTGQIQPQVATGNVPAPSLGPTPAQPQYQLPQATLTKTQKLNLLQERFLRGEVDLETYKELKAEIGADSEDEGINEGADEEVVNEDTESSTLPSNNSNEDDSS